MNKRPKADLAALESRIGHTFVDKGLATLALTHLSAPTTSGGERGLSYQRLEFLGDRVLGVVVAHMLFEAYPKASEGELSVRLAKLVRRETCAAVAEEWDVGPHVVLGKGAVQEGGRRQAAILADVCESLIGAVFLEGGYEIARGLIERAWRARMDAGEPERDAKTAVQEWAQGRGLAAPRYVEAARSGPAHAPHFIMQVVLEGFEPERGEASSKRAAEQAAAQAFLTRWAHP